MSADNRIAIKRALISVSDKSGIVEFAKALAARGVELLFYRWYSEPADRKRLRCHRSVILYRIS